jgi:hypothetical protein
MKATLTVGKYDVDIDGDKVAITHARPATSKEKQLDPGAKVMAEVVNLTFSDDEPKVRINRNLCE